MLYPDVPAWLRIQNGNTGRRNGIQDPDSYHRVHAGELAQEMRELKALEAASVVHIEERGE